MAHPEWLPLWEDDEKRYDAYTKAPEEVKAEMRTEYNEYIQRTYSVGVTATAAEQLSEESSING